MSFSASTSAFLKATLSKVGLAGSARPTPARMHLLAAPAMAELSYATSDTFMAPAVDWRPRKPAVFGKRPPQAVMGAFHPDPHLRLTRDGIWELLTEQDEETVA